MADLTAVVQPPGQQALWPPAPADRPTSLRVLSRLGVSAAVRDLTVASLRAATAAATAGEAWLVAPDGSFAHVDDAGDVTPATGWAALAARVITRTLNPTSKGTTP